MKIDERHYTIGNFKQRITVKDWKKVLLNHGEVIIYRSCITELVAKNLGYGVVEISKEKSCT